MPGFTPNFAIQYPCAGETIDPAVFQTFADDVEAALSTVEAASDFALARPNAAIRDATDSVAFGAMANIAWDTTDFNNNMTPSGAGFIIPQDGLYMADLDVGSITTPTTVTSWAAEIQVGGVTKYRRKVSETSTVPPVPLRLNVSGLVQGTTGQAVIFQFGWTGTGINLVLTARASISLVCDL